MRTVGNILMENILTQKIKKIFSVNIVKCIFGKLWIIQTIIWLKLQELEKKGFQCSESIYFKD